jgi:hypothetical protein
MMVLSQINEGRLRQALLDTALIFLEKNPLPDEHISDAHDLFHKLIDLFDFNNRSLVMCRVAKMAQDPAIDKAALAVAACVLFQRYRLDYEITFLLMEEFLKHNPFDNDLLYIAARFHVQQDHFVIKHPFHIESRDIPQKNDYYEAFLTLFTIASEENSQAFDVAIVNYLASPQITARLRMP